MIILNVFYYKRHILYKVLYFSFSLPLFNNPHLWVSNLYLSSILCRSNLHYILYFILSPWRLNETSFKAFHLYKTKLSIWYLTEKSNQFLTIYSTFCLNSSQNSPQISFYIKNDAFNKWSKVITKGYSSQTLNIHLNKHISSIINMQVIFALYRPC